MKKHMKKFSLLLLAVFTATCISGCNTKGEIEKCVENLNQFDNYYYEIDVNVATQQYYTKTSSQMTYYPASGELQGEMKFDAALYPSYTVELYCVQEEGAFWNYLGYYQESGTTYQKKKLENHNPMYNIGNAFFAVAKYANSFEKGKREEINGNICQQYIVTVPPTYSTDVLGSFGAVSDLEAMGAHPEILQQVLSEYGVTMEIWLDTEAHLPVRYYVDNTNILKETFRRMGFDEQANSFVTCDTKMTLYGQNTAEGEVKVPVKMKNEAVDMTVNQ